MAGDETKRSEAGTDQTADKAGSEGPAPSPEPAVDHAQLGEEIGSAAEPEAAPGSGSAAPPPDETPDAEQPSAEERSAGETETPEPGAADTPESRAADTPEPGAAATPEPPTPTVPITGPAAAPERPRAERGSILARLVPYLVVFAIGALIAVAAAFIMSFLAGPPESSGALEQKLAALDERAATLERRQAEDRKTFGALADRFGTADANARQAVAAVREVEQAVASRLAAAASTDGGAPAEPVDIGPLTARIAALEEKLAALEAAAAVGAAATAGEEADTSVEVARAHATAIVAGRMVQEIGRGEPFAHEINALVALGVDETQLAPLRSSAATGVASLHHLSDEFARLAPAILASGRKTGDDNLVDRLKGYASNLVQIERMNDRAGNDVPSLVARIRFALAHDHVAEALGLWSELPEAAQAASASFGTAAKTREETLAAARQIESGAVAALSKPKS